MSVTAGLASQAATSRGHSFGSGFFGMCIGSYKGFDDGHERFGWLPRITAALRSRIRPIMTFGNPVDIISPPRNMAQCGDQKRGAGSLAEGGGGTFATFNKPYSAGNNGAT